MTKYFEIADSDRTYDEKLDGYLALADEHFETQRYHAWCAEHLGHLDEAIARVGRRSRLRPPAVETVQRRRTPSTSTISSSPTSAG